MDTQSTSSASFWLAAIGAAAWLPQIFGWVSKKMARPAVRILAASSIEVGFNNMGPTVNLPLVFVVGRKDALITRMRMRVVYENGETHSLEWLWIHEVMSFIRGLPANMNLSKQDKAIVLVASVATPLSKTIGFQDPTFQETYRQRVAELTDQFKYLQSREHGKEEFLASRELAEAITWFRESIFWVEGRYRLEVEATVEGLSAPVKSVFDVSLTRPEMDLLRQNGDKISAWVRELIDKGTAVPEPAWNWVNPTLSTRN